MTFKCILLLEATQRSCEHKWVCRTRFRFRIRINRKFHDFLYLYCNARHQNGVNNVNIQQLVHGRSSFPSNWKKSLVSAKIVWGSSTFLLFLRKFNFHLYHIWANEWKTHFLVSYWMENSLSCLAEFFGTDFLLKNKVLSGFVRILSVFLLSLLNNPIGWTTDSSWRDLNLALAMNFILLIGHFFHSA